MKVSYFIHNRQVFHERQHKPGIVALKNRNFDSSTNDAPKFFTMPSSNIFNAFHEMNKSPHSMTILQPINRSLFYREQGLRRVPEFKGVSPEIFDLGGYGDRL